MRILLFGQNGQLGWELTERLSYIGELYAPARTSADGAGDLTHAQAIAEAIIRYRPQVVFNAAAYTAVDKAESEYEMALTVNAFAPAAMAAACAAVDALLVHYSTDYIFDGTGNMSRDESSEPMPLNAYGRSKLEGEVAIMGSGCRHLILRTSWVYGVHGHNFVKTILRLASQQKSLSVVDDQVGTPTSAAFLAESSMELMKSVLSGDVPHGVYNVVPDGFVSWCDFARTIVALSVKANFKLGVSDIEPITSEQYPTPAKRPLNSRLSNEKLKNTLPIGAIKPWQYYLARTLQAMQLCD